MSLSKCRVERHLIRTRIVEDLRFAIRGDALFQCFDAEARRQAHRVFTYLLVLISGTTSQCRWIWSRGLAVHPGLHVSRLASGAETMQAYGLKFSGIQTLRPESRSAIAVDQIA